jgi:hypothetical protein
MTPTRYAVLAGNPPDAPELATSLAHHQTCFGQVPTVLAADRAFDNDRLAHDLRIRSVACRARDHSRPSSRRSDRASPSAAPTAGAPVSKVASVF